MNSSMNDGPPHGPIFAPFIMEGGVKDKEVIIPRRTIIPDPSRASGVRPITVPRQRYRVIQPVVRSTQPIVRSVVDPRYRRPKHANGEGDPLGHVSSNGRSFAKTANLLPSKTKKRIFFEDGDDETLAQRIIAQRTEPPPKLTRKIGGPITHLKSTMSSNFDGGSEIDDECMGMHMVARNIEVPAQSSSSYGMGIQMPSGSKDDDDEFEEINVDIIPGEDAPQLSPNPDMGGPPRIERINHLNGASLRDGGTVGGYQHLTQINKMRATNAAVKQLNGENSYLKDQLDACYYRIKQLETLLMDRNMRLKQLLSENLKQSSKIKRLEQEIGEDAAAELLNGMDHE